MYRNKEGYSDPTAGLAMNHMEKEENRKNYIIKSITDIVNIMGYEFTTGVKIRKLRN